MATEQEIIIKIGAQDNASPTMQAITDELAQVTQQLAAMEAEGKATGKAFDDLTAKQQALTEQSKTYNNLPLEDKLNATKKRMMELAAQGKQNTAQFALLAQEAGRMKRAIEGVEQTVQVLSQNGGRLMVLFTEAVTALSAGMLVAQGAAALFGDENEDLQKAMLKVQAAMSLAMGVQQLVNTLTQRSILLTEAHAAAQKLLAWTTGASTAAMRTFRAALVTTGVGALVVGLGLLIEALASSGDETKEATDYMKKYNKAIEDADAKTRAADDAVRLLTAQMKLQGKTEAQITLEIYKHLKAREAEMLMDEAAAKSALEVAKTRADALKMEIAAKKMQIANDAQRGGAGSKWANEQAQLIKKMQDELDELLPNIAKADAAIKSMGIARQVGLAEAQLAYNAALKTENDTAKEAEKERKQIMEDAYKALLTANERELREHDQATTEQLKKFKEGTKRYNLLQEERGKARKAIVERQFKEEAAAATAAEQERYDKAIAAVNLKIDKEIGLLLSSGKTRAEIEEGLGQLEEQRLADQIQVTKDFCFETAQLEGQLHETIGSNREAAYARELNDLEKRKQQQIKIIAETATDMQQAQAMQTAAELQNLEGQLALAKQYGQDTTALENQIATIKLQTTDTLIQDGKRRLDAAEAVRRQLEVIGKTERQVAKIERQNLLKDSAKQFQDDKKLYDDQLAAGLISEQAHADAVAKLKDEQRARDLVAETNYREKLKTLQSTYATQEIQYAQQGLNALAGMRSAEYERLAQEADHRKEDEILQLDMQLKAQVITQERYEQLKAEVTDKYDKEAEGYERRKFELDKAAAISNALVSTYLAGVQVLAQTKGGTIARFIAMAATITAGLAQVATISAQKFRGRTAGRMSATASLPNPESMQPNQLIGNPQTTNLGGQNQPAPGGNQGGTNGQTNNAAPAQPVRAYVVERDIEQTGQRVRQLSEFATLS